MVGSKHRLACVGVLSLALFSGCGEHDPVASPKSGDASATAQLAAANAEAVRSNQELVRLANEAHELERQFEFDAAVKVWSRLAAMVEERFGRKSWHFKNAEIARAAALRKSQFTDAQKQQFGKLLALNNRTRLALQENEFDQALESSLNVLPLQSELFGDDSIDIGRSLIQIGSLESRLNRGEQAIGHLHQGIAILVKHDAGDHPELEMAHASLADLYSRREKFVPAIANQMAATKIAGNIWGQNSLNFAEQANQLGVIYHRAGNHDVALGFLTTGKSIRQQLLGNDDTAVAHSCLNLGTVMMDKQQLADAEELLGKALSIFRKQRGPDDRLTLRCKTQIATIHMLRQQPALAEPLLSEIVNSMTRAGNQDEEQLLSHQYRLCVALARQGKYDRAQPLVQTVIGRQQKLFGLADERTIASMSAFALMLESTHQKESAAEIRQQISRVAHLTDSNDFQKRF